MARYETTAGTATKSLDDYFADWEGHAFGFGYGTGEDFILPALKQFMSAIGRGPDLPNGYDHETLAEACGSANTWFLINRLCQINMIEYGTSPRYGWLEDEGMRLKAYTDSHTAEQLINIVCDRPDDYIGCYPDVCNCGPHFIEGPVCPNPFWPGRKPR